LIRRGDIRWFRFSAPDKKRPVLVLGRDDVPSLSQVPVIPLSTQARGMAWDGQDSPVPWLSEKTAIALGEAARLVDLANEPDTNAWYREALKAAALPMIARLAPVVAVLCHRPETANEPHKWEPIAEGGTPALRAWIAQHDLERDIRVQRPLASRKRLQFRGLPCPQKTKTPVFTGVFSGGAWN